MNITKSMIQKRITVLDSDIQKSRQKMSELEQQRIESVALLNALMGAKQQCDNFLLELDNVDNLLVSDLKITNNEDKYKDYYTDKEETEFNKILKHLKDKFNEKLQTKIYNINHLDILNVKHLIEYIFTDIHTDKNYIYLISLVDACLNFYIGKSLHEYRYDSYNHTTSFHLLLVALDIPSKTFSISI